MAGRKDAIDARTFEPLLRNRTIENGFVMTILEYGTMNAQMEELRSRCQGLIRDIDAELAR
jgi:hypothetical protein